MEIYLSFFKVIQFRQLLNLSNQENRVENIVNKNLMLWVHLSPVLNVMKYHVQNFRIYDIKYFTHIFD